ncbi:hypothetical protein B0A52_05988 [Exophiala mesophila]|uniref:non-specific serine/threonine protein kinase n=1 Tax=Exophiala mesophila TaxID=212818 RepID=A0A438N4Z5_EXOME|nr:hypothetical protein B0A52_05988 [Exophiala mesophila]
MGSWNIADRHYAYDEETFTKRILFEHERRLNTQGRPVSTLWSTERFENEHAALVFIRENSSIPVPKVLEFTTLGEGIYELKMERVQGTRLSSIKKNKDQATKAVDEYISQFVLPELHGLRSRTVGSLTGKILPPCRLWSESESHQWKPWKSWFKTNGFVHNDLSQGNILVDDNFKVVGIIDWEYSGFYPDEFEAPLWTTSPKDEGYHDIGAEKIPQLVKFLSQKEHKQFWPGNFSLLCVLSFGQ